jgi:DNA-directed RNA polymerase subunit RPC12/RpoP
VRDVEPHWSMAKIDFVYECADCGAEVRHTMRRPESRH